jgi:G3E family GTPase
LREILRRQQRSNFRVRHYFYGENRIAALDFVAVSKHGLADPRAIQKSSVAALAILNVATLRRTLHGKVDARHKRIVRQRKLRPARRAPHQQSMPRKHANALPRKRPRFNFQNHTHRAPNHRRTAADAERFKELGCLGRERIYRSVVAEKEVMKAISQPLPQRRHAR